MDKLSKDMPVDEFAQKRGLPISSVINELESGSRSGRKVDGVWYVSRHGQSQRPARGLTLVGTQNALRPTLGTWISPTFDEVTLYTMSLSAVALFAISPGLRADALLLLNQAPMAVMYTPLLLTGFVFTIINAFVHREKSDFERWLMLWFAIVLQCGTGILVGAILLKLNTTFPLILLPVWNLMNGLLLLVFAYLRIVEHHVVVQEDASIRQIGVATVLVLILVALGEFTWQYHWAFSLSATVGVAGPASKLVDDAIVLMLSERRGA